jgi:hypothetical protein
VRGEVAEGVVAPVVGEPPPQQVRLADEVLHRQQFDGGDPEGLQVPDERGVGQPRVGAAQRRGDVGVAHRRAAHVHLVDDGVRPRRARAPVAVPREGVVHDDAARHVRRRVGRIGEAGVDRVPRVAEQRRVQRQLAVDRAGVGVQEQLGGVVPQPRAGLVAAVHPVAVPLAGADPADPAVPDLVGGLLQPVAVLGPVGVEQAQVDRLGAGGPEREVGPVAVPVRPQRCGGARPDLEVVPYGVPTVILHGAILPTPAVGWVGWMGSCRAPHHPARPSPLPPGPSRWSS